MPTIKDVARLAGISYTTVSHVINKTRHVNADTAKRVVQAIEKLGYRPNQVARSLRIQESLTIGVISPLNQDPYFSSILAGIEAASHSAGYNVIVCYSELDKDKELKNIAMLLDKGVDALVMHCPVDEAGINSVLRLSIPVLFLQYENPDSWTDSIRTNDELGGYIATKHLIDLGHTRIGCLAAALVKIRHSYHDRENGWRRALTEHGIKVDERYIIRDEFRTIAGYKGLERMMKLDMPPSAIFCYNDYLAFGALRAAADLGIRVPEDLSLIGYDDLHLSKFTIPRLTTVSQLKEDLGVMVFKRLLERMQNKTVKPEKYVLRPELVIRESTRRV
jgi:DNA-binding LacI/PurR family transcriptional regulator